MALKENTEDKAYRIATGNYLTKEFNKKDFLLMPDDELESYLTDDFNYWVIGYIRRDINNIAENIIEKFGELI